MHACAAGNVKIVQYLVEQGCDVNEQARDGITPLMRGLYSKSMEVVDYLLDNGANINLGSKQGLTVLTIVCQRNQPDLLEKLIKRGL